MLQRLMLRHTLINKELSNAEEGTCKQSDGRDPEHRHMCAGGVADVGEPDKGSVPVQHETHDEEHGHTAGVLVHQSCKLMF